MILMIMIVMIIMIRSRTCLPTSKWVVLHTVPGLLVGGAGVVLELWQSTVTSHCLHHITRGVAIMLLLPSTVRDCQGNYQLEGLVYTSFSFLRETESKDDN